MLVRKTEVVPIECVVRGYLSGSAWKEYQETGAVCGIELPTGLQESARLPGAIFTPATKAEQGLHDENITYDELVARVGHELAKQLSTRSVEIYNRGAEYALKRGIIIADTKFEFGMIDNELILIDELLTPDSSRFWPADQFQTGGGQPSFDKQFVRDWLTTSGWDKNSPPPALPSDVVAKTRAKYIEAFERVTGESFPWK
jgi:phosphoribosylaminoimidazole-succinocarboxamide synthase